MVVAVGHGQTCTRQTCTVQSSGRICKVGPWVWCMRHYYWYDPAFSNHLSVPPQQHSPEQLPPLSMRTS
eukprot:12907103-Prorocentrum_lima.AAC.1